MEARGEEGGPILKLTMEKGPLAGQGLEFKPGFTVRVGRVVRGNNLTIKDSGVSSKHLTIEFNSGDGKWVIRDLGSSNGTVLNADKLDPSCPAALSDCDVIKIGELTSIEVRIEDPNRASTKPKRNPNGRKTAANTAQNNGDAAENWELGLVGEELGKMRKPPRGRGRPRTRTRAQQNENDLKIDRVEFQPEAIGLAKACLRKTRSSSKAENLDDETGVVEKAESLSVTESAAQNADENGGQRKTRNARGRGCRELRNLIPIEQPLGETKRVTRSRKQTNLQAESVTIVHLEEGGNVAKMSIPKEQTQCEVKAIQNTVEDRQVEGYNTHAVREQTNRGDEAIQNMEDEQMEGNHTVEGKMSKWKGIIQWNMGDEAMQNMEDEQMEGNHTVEEQINLGEESCHGLPNVCGGNKGGPVVGEVVNLENLTLGEWLDYLEINIPKQIIDSTEEMISEMRKKADKFQEFMLHQKNANT